MIDLEKLKNPDSFYRCAPFWSWNDNLKEEELLRQITEMHKKGYGGFFMHSRVGLVTEYLSKEWFYLVKKCIEHAKKLNMLAWIYDEDKWPSGFAGGAVALKNPSYRHKFLVLLKEDQVEQDDEVLSSFVHRNTKYIVAKRTMRLGDKWFNGSCYVDLLSKEVTKEFINLTHEEYKKVCQEYFGNAMPGIFTDEPTYLRVHYKDIPTLPWTEKLPDRFLQKKGYDIKEHFEELFFNVGNYHKVRFDFFDIALEMFIENFTIPYAKWCEENGIMMTGHYMAEDTMRGQTEWIGAAMPHYEYMRLPGIDKLARHLEQTVTIKQVSSVCEQLDKKGVLCETFGTTGQHVSFLHRKWISDWQAVLGVTYINPHLSLYSMRGERKRDYPPNLFYQQPWWEDEKFFADYLARISYIAGLGKRDVDVLVIHPISSAWAEYSRFDDSVDKLDSLLDKTVKELIANKIDFHFGDEIILSKYAQIENGKIRVGSYNYKVVVLPPLTNLRKTTMQLLQNFINSGGKVVSLKDFMFSRFELCMIDGSKCDIPLKENFINVSNIDDLVSILKEEVSTYIEVIDKKTGQNAKKIILQSRKLDDGSRIIFLANTDLKREVEITIKIPTDNNVFAADLVDFGIFNIPTLKRENGFAVIDATMHPASSLCLLVSDKQFSQNTKNVISGVVFDNSFEYRTGSCEFDIELKDYNTLILDIIKYEVDGKVVFEDCYVSQVWHKHFYNLPEGTPFKATYYFEVEKVPSQLFVAIECAENLDMILVNGQSVKFERKTESFSLAHNFLDVNISKIDITPFIKQGKNEIVISGRKSNNITAPGCHERVKDPKNHRPTEVEAIYLIGNFSLICVDETRFVITEPKKPCHYDITKDGYPFYVGTMSLKSSFEITKENSKRVYIKLNNVSAAVAKVFVNGKEACILFSQPFLADITEHVTEGKNDLEIVLTNTLFNLIEANHKADVFEELFRRPQSFIDFENFTSRYMLLPFGLGSYSILTSEF